MDLGVEPLPPRVPDPQPLFQVPVEEYRVPGVAQPCTHPHGGVQVVAGMADENAHPRHDGHGGHTVGGVTPTAGYSGTPLARKLGVKPGHRLVLWSAPPGWSVPDLPQDVQVVHDDGSSDPAGGTDMPRGADVCVAFCRSPGQLHTAVAAHAEGIRPAGALWIAWPRRAAGHRSDITENLVRDTVLPLGLVDVKVAALDADWSGLKVVWRREHRTGGGEPPLGQSRSKPLTNHPTTRRKRSSG